MKYKMLVDYYDMKGILILAKGEIVAIEQLQELFHQSTILNCEGKIWEWQEPKFTATEVCYYMASFMCKTQDDNLLDDYLDLAKQFLIQQLSKDEKEA